MFNRGHWKKLTDTPHGPKVDTGSRPSYDVAGATPENFTTDWLTDKTIEFIEQNRNKPFCYMLSIPDPHGPDSVRAPYNKQYTNRKFTTPHTAGKDASSPPSWATRGGGSTALSQYFGMVKCIDDNVGRILDHLRQSKLLGHTIVVFTSDHGDLCGEHGRHNKGVPLEASAKVPFLIYCPGKVKPGTVVSQALGTVDFLPTVLGLMGVKTTGKEEGRDASALFERTTAAADWKDITFVRGTGPEPNWIAAFTSRYKLILSPNDPPWLIDMQEDPDELKNYCSDPAYRDVTRTLAKELLSYGQRFNDQHVSEAGIAEHLARLAEAD
jgi:arylsulfatase A-like enzyme